MLPGELPVLHRPDIEPGERLIPGRGAECNAILDGDLEEKVNVIVLFPRGDGRLLEESCNVRLRIGKAPVEKEDLLADVPRGLPRILTEFQVARGEGPAVGVGPDPFFVHAGEALPVRMRGIFPQQDSL